MVRNSVIELIKFFERSEKTLERVNIRYEPFKVDYHRYFIHRTYNPMNKKSVDYNFDELKRDRKFLLISHNVHQLLSLYTNFHTSSYEKILTLRNQIALKLNEPEIEGKI